VPLGCNWDERCVGPPEIRFLGVGGTCRGLSYSVLGWGTVRGVGGGPPGSKMAGNPQHVAGGLGVCGEVWK